LKKNENVKKLKVTLFGSQTPPLVIASKICRKNYFFGISFAEPKTQAKMWKYNLEFNF